MVRTRLGLAGGPAIATPVPGTALADPAWLAERVTETERSWACTDRRVIGTLWWYMASSAFLEAPLRELTHTGSAPDPTLTGLTCSVRADGSLETVRFNSQVVGIASFAAALRPALGAIIDPLAEVSGASAPSLWSIAADALGNRALYASPRDPEKGVELALTLAAEIGGTMPAPRFVDVSGRRFVRRGSCCLIYETARADKCISCPRRAPEERAGLLTELVRRGR